MGNAFISSTVPLSAALVMRLLGSVLHLPVPVWAGELQGDGVLRL